MQQRLRSLCQALTVLLLLAGPAGADSPVPRQLGDQSRLLLPAGESRLRVEKQTLTISFPDGITKARVEAVYRIANTSRESMKAELGYLITTAEELRRDRKASVQVDGAPLPFRVTNDVERLGPEIRAWIDQHAPVREVMARIERQPSAGHAEQPQLTAALKQAGVGPGSEAAAERLIQFAQEPTRIGILATAKLLMPERIGQLTGGPFLREPAAQPWIDPITGERTAREFGGPDQWAAWVYFDLELPPGATRTVTIGYEHSPGLDSTGYINPAYQYQIRLAPGWSGSGTAAPLAVQVRLPEAAYLGASVPLEQNGLTYRAELPGPTEDQLLLSVMFKRGLILGRTRPGEYRAALVLLLVLLSVPLGWRLGERWVRMAARYAKPAGRRTATLAVAVVGGGLVGVLANMVFVAILFSLWKAPKFMTPDASRLQLLIASAATAAAGAVAALRILGGHQQRSKGARGM